MHNKFLFITLSNIGDALMTIPVMEYIHKKHPTYKVDIVCDSKSYDLFKYCPYLNKIYLKDKKKGFFGNLKLLLTLRKNYYEIAVDLRTDLLLYFIKSKKKFFKVNDKKVHSVIKHFAALNIEQSYPIQTNFWIPKDINNNIKKRLGENFGRVLALGIGANSPVKIWPSKNYANLVNYLKKSFDLVVLVGDDRDKKISLDFVKNTTIKTINFCGKLSIIETAALIKLSKFFIGNDSGLGHLASAVKTPSYSIFGIGNPIRYSPWGKKAFWYQNNEKDILKITPEEIYEDLRKII